MGADTYFVKLLFRVALCAAGGIALSSCATLDAPRSGLLDRIAAWQPGRGVIAASTASTARQGGLLGAVASSGSVAGGSRQEQLVAAAHDLIGVDRLFVGGRSYQFDCSGLMLAIYAKVDMNLAKEYPRYSGNGVRRIYKMAQAYGVYFAATPRTVPAPGDLVFFDNTYDRDGDGNWNDELTHMAMVISVSRDGTIRYVHNHLRKGIVIEQMNLRRRDVHRERFGKGAVVNAAMRMRGAPRDSRGRWLSSHLVRGFASAYALPL